jgi:uncharacterized protein YqeY
VKPSQQLNLHLQTGEPSPAKTRSLLGLQSLLLAEAKRNKRGTLEWADEIALLRRIISARKELTQSLTKQGNPPPEMVAFQEETMLLETFLPTKMTSLDAIVQTAIQETKAKNSEDFGRAMRLAAELSGNENDEDELAQLLRQTLATTDG